MSSYTLEPFDAGSDSARAARARAATACAKFNSYAFDDSVRARYLAYLDIVGEYSPDDDARYGDLSDSELNNLSDSEIKNLFPTVEPDFTVQYGTNLHIAETAYISHSCFIADNPIRPVAIGYRTMIGENTQIHSVNHPTDALKSTEPFGQGDTALSQCASVIIGHFVVIEGGTIILPGVMIGNCAVVRAGSVVTRDVQEGCTVAGNPAEVVERPEYTGDAEGKGKGKEVPKISATSNDEKECAKN